MIIDTHCHVNFKDFQDDADEIIRRALANDVWMIIVGSEYKTSKRALKYANKYEKGVYSAVGLHPVHLENIKINNDDENGKYKFHSQAEEFYYDNYEQLAKFEKVVAIGEIGLDYYHLDPKSDVEKVKKKQQEIFVQQLLLARSLDLPVIIHCRQAHDDMVDILREFKKKYSELIPTNKPWGVMHCFSGNEDLAWKYFNLGLIISFTGLITFSKQWDELIRKVPLEKVMIETDSPYMTPEPNRGKRNEPSNVYYVAKKIADIRNIKIEKVVEMTSKTARNLFKI